MSKTEKKAKPSGPAIFMYCVIVVTVVIALVCFVLHYANLIKGYPTLDNVVLWVGIVCFMITYHFWMRIIMGNVSKLFTIHYKQRWFRERRFEQKLYKLLRVRKWKEKVLTYNPDHFSTKLHSYEEIANTMAKSEVDHWLNELIALSSILFSLIWGELWIFVITAVAAMIFDSQFIIVQRYNRPIVLRVAKMKAERGETDQNGI